jgi:hypothetical protein
VINAKSKNGEIRDKEECKADEGEENDEAIKHKKGIKRVILKTLKALTG